MATLNTMRAILKDARMREQAGAIRRELGLLFSDVDRLGTRVENLDRHFNQASKDISDIKISADKAGRRARRLDNFDFEELAPGNDDRTRGSGPAERAGRRRLGPGGDLCGMFGLARESVRALSIGMLRSGSPGEKGTRCDPWLWVNSVTAPATVSGERYRLMPLSRPVTGRPGKAPTRKSGDLP